MIKVCLEQCADYSQSAVDAAVSAALAELGGMANFVKPQQIVLLKPNLLSPRHPDLAVTTHPALVAAVARLCWQAGAGQVWIADSPAGAHSDQQLWQKTGMQQVAAELGAQLQSVSAPLAPRACGQGMQLPVPAWLEQVDVIIDLPKLKTHLLTTLTGAMKNMYGLVVGQAKSHYHASYPAPQAMSAFLVDVYEALRPHLVVMDAIVAMEGNGPANGRPRPLGIVLAASDAVALDWVACRYLNTPPLQIAMLKLAVQRQPELPAAIQVCGSGATLTPPPLRLPIGRWMQHLPGRLFHWLSWLLCRHPAIDPGRCCRCELCARVCSQKAIVWHEASQCYRVDRQRCILCMCCLESCPHDAVAIPGFRLRAKKSPGK